MRPRRPEHNVLLCIGRRELDAEKEAQLRHLLHQELDWDYLLSTATSHGLTPLLHKNLPATLAEHLPGEFLAKLKQESLANSQSVLQLAGKLLKVHQLFTENEIPVATFKGPLLAQMAYGEISLRQAGDIDILIGRPHFEHAKLLLESLGYQMSPQLTPAQLTSHLGFHCEIPFKHDDWFTVVDLHWGLAPKTFVFNLAADEVMSRLQPFSLAGTQIQTFGTEDLILYQAMHGAKHFWRRLEWICSLAELVRHSECIVWQTLVGQAATAHATRILGLGLRLVERFSDVRINEDVLAAIDGDNAMRRFAEQIDDQLFITDSALPDSARYDFAIMDRKRDALASVLRAIFVPTLSDWEALSLPGPLHSLYYAFRPLRLSKVYGNSLWRRISHQARHPA